MWINDDTLFDKYESYACILQKQTIDELPKLANALNNILFALTVDAPDLNNDRKINLTEREEPIIPVPHPNNLEVHKKVTKVRRKVIEFEDNRKSLSSDKDLGQNQRTPSPLNVVLEVPIVENGHSHVENTNKGMIEEQMMFALESSQCGNSNSNISMMNESIGSMKERERKSSLVKSRESVAIILTEETGVEVKEDSILSSKGSSINSDSEGSLPTFNESIDIEALKQKLREKEERCAILESQVADLSL